MPPSLSFGSRVERVELRGESDELWSARRSHRVVKTKSNSLCLIGGLAEGDSAGDVWLCKDGATRTTSEGVLQTTWSCVCSRTAFRSRDGHAAVVTSAGSILVLGGASTQVDLLTTSQVWKSEDEGSTWNLVTSAPGWSARTHHEAVVLKDSVFVVGGFGEFGYCNDSWISSDQGETWRRASSSAPWSKRAMHAATSFRGAIYLSGGYEDRGSPCNDVWASKDAASWTRLAHRAPWRPRRGHTLCAAGDDCLILTGGESGAQNSQNSESFGDCWTSRDGATWSLVCFDAPPRQFHASVCHDRTLIVFGGAEAINSRNNDSKKSRAERSKTHSDAWAVDIRENVAPTLGSMAPSFSPRMECIDISTSSVVAYISELQQLRAALREVQRGNVQLVQLVSNATECAELRHALRFAASAKGHDEPFAIKPVAAKTPMRSMSQETLSSRFQRAWSNCKSSSTSLLDEKHNEDDGESVVPPESVNSYFDAREDDSESSHSGTPPPLSTPTTNEVGVLPEAGATPFLTDTFLGVVKDAFAIDSEIDAHWREKIWPLLRETGEEAVRRPESRDLAACVERRAQAFKDATDALATAEARYSSLETESLCLRKRASLALLQIRARLAVESEQRITTQRCTAIARICDTASFNDLQRTAMTAIASNDGSHVDEGDPQPLFVGDTGEAEALFSAEDKMMLEAIQGRDDRENFEIVAADLRAHCTRPERANSARRATDTALTRLAGAFEARADAADALRASIHYTATNKQENDDSIKVEEEVSLRTLAAATLWDEGISLCKAKLDAHAAIGRELSIIPCELDQALALKRRLLRAAENRCLEVSLRVRIILSVIAALQRRARAWAVYLNTGDAVKRAVSLCKKAAIARDDVVAIEDQKSDAIAAIEKVARRRRAACSLDRRRIACSRQESCGAGWVETGAANPTTAESGAFEHMLSLSTGLVFTNAAQPEVLSKETSAPEDFFIASNATTIPSPEQQECRLTESIRVSNQGHLDTCSESANTAGEPHAQSISAQCRSSIELQDVRQVQPSLEEVEYEFARKVNFLEAKLCEARQMRRRSIANAARCAYIEAPEVARDNSIIVDALGRFKLLGVEGDDIDSKESIGKSMFFAPSSKPKQTTQNSHRSIDTQGAWARNLNRHLDEFCAFKPISST